MYQFVPISHSEAIEHLLDNLHLAQGLFLRDVAMPDAQHVRLQEKSWPHLVAGG